MRSDDRFSAGLRSRVVAIASQARGKTVDKVRHSANLILLFTLCRACFVASFGYDKLMGGLGFWICVVLVPLLGIAVTSQRVRVILGIQNIPEKSAGSCKKPT
jgi:hypothetical protein